MMDKRFSLAFAAIAMMGLAACTSDNNDVPEPIQPQAVVVTFEKAKLAEDGTMKGISYSEAGFVFQNYYTNEGWEYNSGFTASACTDQETAGSANQYSVFANSGVHDSRTFAIYNRCYYEHCHIMRTDSTDFRPLTVAVALTTYTTLSTKQGDAWAKKFEADDWFKAIFIGYNAQDEEVARVEVPLIERATWWTPWAWVDLTPLGTVNKIYIDFDSSDKSEWGINTPDYLALDDFMAYEE